MIALLPMMMLPLVSAYSLRLDYGENGFDNFFNHFSFWDSSQQADPTHGYVDYLPEDQAWSAGLIANRGTAFMGVEHNDVASGPGRKSARLTSNEYYTPGTLFVADILHMPAFCTTAVPTATDQFTWPDWGEIDVVEEVNVESRNRISLHVSDNEGPCNVNRVNMRAMPNSWGNCTATASIGCDADDTLTDSFGPGFNAASGGVYAMEYIPTAINVWFWPRTEVPSSSDAAGPLGNSPDPSSWGEPTASFQGCDIASHVKKQHIIIDTTFCGWAESEWQSQGCAASTKTNSCQEYVHNNPGAYETAYWNFASLKVYT